jgi:hypothetical protein
VNGVPVSGSHIEIYEHLTDSFSFDFDKTGTGRLLKVFLCKKVLVLYFSLFTKCGVKCVSLSNTIVPLQVDTKRHFL